MNTHMANVAKAEACKFFHGNVMGAPTNLHPIADLFSYSENWTVNSWDNCWYAAFVYWCCIKADYKLPVRYINEAVSCNFAGCIAWEQWAKLTDINHFCYVAPYYYFCLTDPDGNMIEITGNYTPAEFEFNEWFVD